PRYQVETTVRTGRPADEILAAAEQWHADLVVLSTHGRTGAQRWLLGSVADAVVRQAELPVYLVGARALAVGALAEVTVGEVMTRDLATVEADEPVLQAMWKLLRRRVGGAPVVDATGKL